MLHDDGNRFVRAALSFRAPNVDARPCHPGAHVGRNSFRSTTDRIKARAREAGLTLRQTALEVATPRAGFVGAADRIADELIRWTEQGAADGFILGFPVIAEGLSDFIRLVVPILEERGYYDRILGGSTPRDHLGLP